MNAIDELSKIRKSDEIISYLTSDKEPRELFPTKIGMDAVEIFQRHLAKIGRKNKISLFLHTSGGVLEAPWPLVSIIREYCKEFEVIVPSKALSAGTLICLGSDKILMARASFLSPIDPEGAYTVAGNMKSIQVEDVTGFLDFIKDKVGIIEQNALAEVVKQLTSEIPASVLGSVNRTHSLIRMLARKMLKTHNVQIDEEVQKQIVENLTARLFSHKHLINRKEAKDSIGFGTLIDLTKTREEKLVRDIFNKYKEEMQFDKEFNPLSLLGESPTNSFDLKRAIIKSSAGEDAFMTTYEITRNQTGPQPFNINMTNIGWRAIGNLNMEGGENPT